MDGIKPVEHNVSQQATTAGEKVVNTARVREKGSEERAIRSPQATAATGETSKENSDIEIQNIVAKLNEATKFFRAKITFSYDPRINRSVILVIDSETGEIIRQIPPEEMVMLISKLQELAGLLFNKKA